MFMLSQKVMGWCAVTRENVIGPYFFEDGNADGEKNRNMLINYAFPRFATLRQDYIFQQYGAPAHYSSRVRNYFDNERPNIWIGRGGPVYWPPRSPYLTPPDFFLWGHINQRYAILLYTLLRKLRLAFAGNVEVFVLKRSTKFGIT